MGGKTALVTGGARCIGYACVEALAEDGHRIILFDINAEEVADTAMMAGVNANPEAVAIAMSRTPLKRMENAREVGDVIAFLCSDKASYITGETVYVDGSIGSVGHFSRR